MIIKFVKHTRETKRKRVETLHETQRTNLSFSALKSFFTEKQVSLHDNFSLETWECYPRISCSRFVWNWKGGCRCCPSCVRGTFINQVRYVITNLEMVQHSHKIWSNRILHQELCSLSRDLLWSFHGTYFDGQRSVALLFITLSSICPVTSYRIIKHVPLYCFPFLPFHGILTDVVLIDRLSLRYHSFDEDYLRWVYVDEDDSVWKDRTYSHHFSLIRFIATTIEWNEEPGHVFHHLIHSRHSM